jgi:peptidoglycan/LPS O-acetylase OafA/YrhL
VFFVLSGFVLAPQILYCIRDGRAVSLSVFLMRRWMRTIPPFLMALAAISMLMGQLLTGDFFRYVLYAQNALAQHNHHDYFAVAWSLSVEEWFYVVFPSLIFVAAMGWQRSDRRFALIVALAFISCITVLRSASGNFGDWDESVRRVVVFRIDSIGYGFLLYLFLSRITDRPASRARAAKTALIVMIWIGTALAGLYVTRRAVSAQDVLGQQVFPFAAAAFGMATIAAFCALRSAAEASPAGSRFCSFMGKISYSIYLFHIILILILRPAIEWLPIPVQLGIYGGCLVAFSALFYTYFEKPILAARPKYKPRPLFSEPKPALSQTV